MNPKSMRPNSTRNRMGAMRANSTREVPSSRRRTLQTSLVVIGSRFLRPLLDQLNVGPAAREADGPSGGATVAARLVAVGVPGLECDRVRTVGKVPGKLVLDVGRIFLLARDD